MKKNTLVLTFVLSLTLVSCSSHQIEKVETQDNQTAKQAQGKNAARKMANRERQLEMLWLKDRI